MAKDTTTHEIRIVDVRASKGISHFKGIAIVSALFAALFVPGLMADSAAMQWAGFVLLLFMLMLMASVWASKKMTIEEARAELDKLEGK